MSLTPLPTLDELAARPERAQELPPEVARDLLAQLAPLQTVLLAQAIRPLAGGNSQGEPQGEDRLLTVEEAAGKLAVSTDWLYRRAGKLPFTVRLGRQLRFSERGLDRYIRQRQAR